MPNEFPPICKIFAKKLTRRWCSSHLRRRISIPHSHHAYLSRHNSIATSSLAKTIAMSTLLHSASNHLNYHHHSKTNFLLFILLLLLFPRRVLTYNEPVKPLMRAWMCHGKSHREMVDKLASVSNSLEGQYLYSIIPCILIFNHTIPYMNLLMIRPA